MEDRTEEERMGRRGIEEEKRGRWERGREEGWRDGRKEENRSEGKKGKEERKRTEEEYSIR